MITILYFFCLIPSTILIYLIKPSLCHHGHTNSLLSKNLFFFFYLTGIIFFIWKQKFSFYLIHLSRRLLETIFFPYKKSRMNILHFILGISYYLILSYHFCHYSLKLTKTFLFLNFLQFLTHFKRTNSHYLIEFLLYLHLFLKIRTFTLFLNLFWIAIFIYITLRLRYIQEIRELKKIKNESEKNK